jgi:hypothetical protein
MATKAKRPLDDTHAVTKATLANRLSEITKRQQLLSTELNTLNERRNQVLAQLNMSGGAANEINELIALFDEDSVEENNTDDEI